MNFCYQRLEIAYKNNFEFKEIYVSQLFKLIPFCATNNLLCNTKVTSSAFSNHRKMIT